jgi:uncharacterized protein
MRTDIAFDSSGLKLAGHLYVPDGLAARHSPAVVVSHPAGGVKEQAAGLYTQRLAQEGFVTLAFDAELATTDEVVAALDARAPQ